MRQIHLKSVPYQRPSQGTFFPYPALMPCCILPCPVLPCKTGQSRALCRVYRLSIYLETGFIIHGKLQDFSYFQYSPCQRRTAGTDGILQNSDPFRAQDPRGKKRIAYRGILGSPPYPLDPRYIPDPTIQRFADPGYIGDISRIQRIRWGSGDTAIRDPLFPP